MKPSRRPEVRRARYARLNSIVEPIDLSGIESLFDELGDAAEAAARPGAQAAAQVIHDAAKTNVAALGRVSGNLAASIYQAYSRDNSGDGYATYHVSWNARTAPHGGLVEYGHWQRYVVVNTKRGPRNAIRPEMQGRPKPRRRASQAEKDAYYVLRPGGPIYVPGKAFMRRAAQAGGAALLASADVLWQALEEVR
jgi:hypothetical protein